MGENHYQKLKHHVQLEATAATIKPYGSPPIPTLGRFSAKLSTNKGSLEATFYVAQGNQPLALLGKYTAFDLNILKIDVAEMTEWASNVCHIPRLQNK